MLLRGKVLRPYWRLRFHSFGVGSVFHKPVWLSGAHKIAVGDHAVVMQCWIAAERPAWGRPGPALVLGDRVTMRPFSTITAAESIVLEDDVAVGSHSYISDLEHLRAGKEAWADSRSAAERAVENPNVVSPIETTPVRIGRGTWIGERVAVLRGSNVGAHCVIGTNSVVRGTIPDYSIAVGAPARVVGSTLEA